MKEYIDKSALLEKMSRNSITEKITFADGKSIIETVREFPAADVVERKRGRWIEVEFGWGDVYYDCSVCGESFCLIDGTPTDNLYNFCPNCGADMREVTE